MKISLPNSLAISVLALCFLLGGAVQFFGIFTLTQSNYVAIFLIAVYLLLRPLKIQLDRSEVVLAALALYIFLGPFLNGSRPEGVAVYLYYLACPFLAVRFAKQAIINGPSTERFLFRVLIGFMLVQLIVTMVQSIFAEELSRTSAISVLPVDIVSGTFYLASDGSLSAFCILACMAALWTDLPIGKKLLVFGLALTIIGIANSKAFQALAPLLAGWALVEAKLLRGRNSLFKGVLFFIGLAIIVAVSYETVFEKLGEFSDYLYDIYDFRYGDNRAQRLTPLGEILYSPISWFGQGALTYYNPLTKEWLYNSGFSLIYSFYFDFGLVGLLLVLAYFGSLTFELAGFSLRSLTLYFIFLVFCAFSPAITDLAFAIAYTTTCAFVMRGRISMHAKHAGSESRALSQPSEII